MGKSRTVSKRVERRGFWLIENPLSRVARARLAFGELSERIPVAFEPRRLSPYIAALEKQCQSPQTPHRFFHEGVFLLLVARQVGDREAQIRSRVVPRHANHRLLVDQKL